MNKKCAKCNKEFGEFCYHNLLNNELWCHECAKETYKSTLKGNNTGNVEGLNYFAKLPSSILPLPHRQVEKEE